MRENHTETTGLTTYNKKNFRMQKNVRNIGVDNIGYNG